MNKKSILYILVSIMSIILMAACGKKAECPYEITEGAVVYEYPSDNVASLSSVIVDEEKSQCIYVFSSKNRYASLDEMKKLVSSYVDGKDYYIDMSLETDDGWEVVAISDVELENDGDYVYLKLTVEDVDITACDLLFGQSSNYSVTIRNIGSPLLFVSYENKVRDNEGGELVLGQDFDVEGGKWNEAVETFYPTHIDTGV